MMRWVESDDRRLHAQEQALLALLDRQTILEQAFTAELDKHRAMRARLDHMQTDLARALTALAKLERENRVLIDLLDRGK